MTDADNLPPRDHNNPPAMLPAEELVTALPEQHAALAKDVTDLLASIRSDAPENVETDQDNIKIGAMIVELRDTLKIVDAKHENEKAPYLRGGRVVDQFFFGMRDRLTKAREILQKRGDAFTARKVAEEQAERRRAADAAAAEARRKSDEAAAAERAAAEKAAAADRARKPENIERLTEEARALTSEASVRQVDEMIATSEAENARLMAQASPAAIARTRDEATGLLATAGTKDHAEIVDAALLDKDALWPFIKEEEKLRALKAWAKTTGFNKPMNGAKIEKRVKGAYR